MKTVTFFSFFGRHKVIKFFVWRLMIIYLGINTHGHIP